MLGLFFFIVALLLARFIVWVLLLPSPDKRLDESAVRSSFVEGERCIESEYLRARRAMNDTAGQSWRNLAG